MAVLGALGLQSFAWVSRLGPTSGTEHSLAIVAQHEAQGTGGGHCVVLRVETRQGLCHEPLQLLRRHVQADPPASMDIWGRVSLASGSL